MNMADKSDRRNFISKLIGGGALMVGGASLYPVAKFLIPPRQTEAVQRSVNFGKEENFPNASGSIFRFGNKPGILVRTEKGEFRAFSAVCTHLSCTVQFSKEHGDIWCACHNGHYDLSGNNISGPPPRPLEKFDVMVKNGEIFISRKI